MPSHLRTLTVADVARELQVDVRLVRRLLKRQREEDAAAAAAERPPSIVGLRAVYVSPRVTRIEATALYAYLESEQLRLTVRRRRR